LLIICGVVCRIPNDPGVPMTMNSLPSRKTAAGAMHISMLRFGPITFGLSGSKSNQ
jgi:hypothetical protein